MEAVVVDYGSKLLKDGIASPHQDPPYIIPTKMKQVLEEGEAAEGNRTGNEEEVMVDTVVKGFVSDWDAMEDLLHHVLYTNIGWEIGDGGQILFTEPLFTLKGSMLLNKLYFLFMLLVVSLAALLTSVMEKSEKMIIKGLFKRYERWNPVHQKLGAFWGMGIGVGCGVGWGPGFGPEVVVFVGAGCGVGFNVGITFIGIGVGLPQNDLIKASQKWYISIHLIQFVYHVV